VVEAVQGALGGGGERGGEIYELYVARADQKVPELSVQVARAGQV